ncbi:MAG: transposase [Prevotellaceae bacterium]|jgi:transposase-like protein|nr:transposase [Prevotellaceae bacterium]
MVRRERKFYSEEFKERVLTAYYNSNESVSMIARRFDISKDTVSSWVYRKRMVNNSKKRVKLDPLETTFMKEKELSTGGNDLRIKELERALSTEKMRSESLEKMIEIAERELKIDIRKKSGARQSMR